MSDFLVVSLGFILIFQGAALVVALLLRASDRVSTFLAESRGHYPLLIPAVIALAGTAAYFVPHALGALTGSYHSTRDVDAGRPGAPALWVLAVVAFVTLRGICRLAGEAAVSIRLARSRVSSVQAAVGTKLEDLALRLTELLEGASPPRIFLHRAQSYPEPFLRGFFRPTLHLHADLARALDGDHLAAIVLHEVEHRRGRDHVVVWVYSLVLSPLNFSRSLRDRYRQWREAREIACDDFAAERLGSRKTVAAAIVAVVRFAVRGRPTPDGAIAFGGCADLVRRRVRRLLDDGDVSNQGRAGEAGGQRSGVEHRRLQVVVLVVVAGLLFMSCATPQVGLGVFCMLEHTVGMHCLA